MLRDCNSSASPDLTSGGSSGLGAIFLPMEECEGKQKPLAANVSRITAKNAGFYNFGCKRVLLTVELSQPLPELDLQRAEGRRKLWPTRTADLFRRYWLHVKLQTSNQNCNFGVTR